MNNQDMHPVYANIRSKLGQRSLVLIGMMGAGKTTIGRRIAKKLNLPFRDADQEIEAAANLTVPEMFELHGEAYFREGEKKVIARLLNNGPQVLATGGGAWMNEETRKVIAARGISIWLQAEIAILMERVQRRSHRPLLKTDNPEETMRALIEQRYPVYKLADLTVPSRDAPHDAIVQDLVDILEMHLERCPEQSGIK